MYSHTSHASPHFRPGVDDAAGLWAGLRPLDSNNNLAFFVPFSTPHSPPAIRVVLVVLAATMNESAVDSLQNAIVATISSNFMVITTPLPLLLLMMMDDDVTRASGSGLLCRLLLRG